ncbi:MAG: hypothetical protein ACI9XO_001126 [Paraglaciecola sp.]
MVSSGITVANGDFAEMGELIYLDLNSSSETKLVTGTYIFSANRAEFTMVDASIGFGVEVVSYAGTIIEATCGTVEVSKEGNQTVLDFSLPLAGGATVSGN